MSIQALSDLEEDAFTVNEHPCFSKPSILLQEHHADLAIAVKAEVRILKI